MLFSGLQLRGNNFIVLSSTTGPYGERTPRQIPGVRKGSQSPLYGLPNGTGLEAGEEGGIS